MNDKLSQHIERRLRENKRSTIQYILAGLIACIPLVSIFIFLPNPIHNILQDLSKSCKLLIDFYTTPNDLYQNLITVIAGIAAIVFAIFILIAETLRDDRFTYKARVLLNISKIKFLSIFTLVLFGVIIILEIIGASISDSYIHFILIFLSVISIIILLVSTIYQLIKVLNTLLNKQIFEEDKISFIVDNIIRNISFHFEKQIANEILLSQGSEISIGYLPTNNNQDAYYSLALKEGEIEDIDLLKLRNLVQKLKDKQPKPKTGIHLSVESLPLTLTIQINFYSTYKDNVNQGSRLLAITPKSFIDAEIEKIIQNIFIIAESDYSETQNILSNMKDSFMTAIMNKHTGEITSLSQQYISIIEKFSVLCNKKFHRYNLEEIHKEALRTIQPLTRDIRELINKAIDSQDKYIIYSVTSIPIQISWIALKHNDRYLFGEYLGFLPYLYQYSIKYRNGTENDIHEHLTKRIFMNLRDIKYGIQANPNKDTFITELLYVFLKLLREILSSDNKDFKSCRIVIRRLVEIKEDFKDINTQVDELLWGITGWLVFRYKEDIDYKEVYDPVEAILLNNNIEDLTDKFVAICDKEYGFFYEIEEWDRDSTDAEYGEILTYNLNPYKNRNYLYCILALKLLNRGNIDKLYLLENNESPKIETLGRVKSQLYPILDEINKDKDNWKFVLTDKEVNQIAKFKALFDDIEQRYKDGEAHKKRIANVPDNNIDIFKEAVIKSFWESVRIRKFIQYEISTKKTSDDVPLFGFNRLLDKGIFLDDSSSKSFGQSYGEGLARGENSSLFDKIAGKCENIKDDINSFMRDKGSDFIILTNTWYLDLTSSMGNELVIDYSNDISYSYKGMPIHQISHDKDHNTLLFVHKSKIGKLIQFVKDKDSNIDIDIKVLSDSSQFELRQQMIRETEWLSKKENPEAYLEEQVAVKILEQWEYEAEYPIGYKFYISED